jgi:hypothetical protein
MNVLTCVIAFALALGAWLICAYVAFSRTTLRTVVRLGIESDDSRRVIWTWKYPQWRGWAKTGLVLIPILAAIGPLVLLIGGTDGGAGTEMQAAPLPTTVTPSPMPTATASPTLMAAPPTSTPSRTPTQTAATPSTTPTQAPSPTLTAATPSSTPTQTPSPTPIVTTSTATSTSPPTSTPTPSPTVTAPARTQAPRIAQPEPLEPLLGRDYKNPVTFRWSGSLGWQQAYQVTAYHLVSGDSVQSELLTTPEWSIDLPAERFGEWRWSVSVIGFGRILSTSPEWMFWFDPIPGPRNPRPTPTSTPTQTPTPTRIPETTVTPP